MADLAVTYSLNTELLRSTVSSRMGSTIQGKADAGLLYTPAYVRNIKAQLRGALRGTAAPVALTSLVKDLGLDSFSGSNSMVSQLVDELLSEGAVRGSTKGGGGSWVPNVHTAAQQGAVSGFYTQNGWVGYDLVRKAGISNERAYLKQSFPEGLALESGGDATACLCTKHSDLPPWRTPAHVLSGQGISQQPCCLSIPNRSTCYTSSSRLGEVISSTQTSTASDSCLDVSVAVACRCRLQPSPPPPLLLRCLCAVFVSPSVVSQAEAAVEEALHNGTWLDVGTMLPPSLAVQDVAQLLASCGVGQEEDAKRGQVCWY
eukprot:GHRQ01016391.1.p1 GENE.GHRQ01016391.1~~GHRQ01016391.1.p1  ORF type:complete len:342 (-),score=133.95 GHRQ01016391.1:88-1038(-)